MADKLVLYTNPMSRGRIARWMLEELGEPYRTEVLDFDTGMKSPGFLALNPMGKVPTLRHGDLVVTEAAAICAYLADAFPQAGLAPAQNDRLRGSYYRWMFFAAGPLEAAVTNRALNFTLPPGKGRMAGYGSYEDTIGALEHAVLQHEYLAGGFTAADVYVGSQIGWGLMFGTIEKRPAFLSYHRRLAARPAARRAEQLDDALMPRTTA